MHYILSVSLQGFYLSSLERSSSKPYVVYAAKKVLDCNRVAFNQGVRIGMDARASKMLAPDQQPKSYQSESYISAQEQWLNRLIRYSNCVEPLAAHAAYVDLSAHPRAEQICNKLIEDLRTHLPYVVTWGLAGSKWQSDLARLLDAGNLCNVNITEFLRPLPLEFLSLIPSECMRRLTALGFSTIGDLADLSESSLAEMFGDQAYSLRAFALGIASDRVNGLYPVSSVSSEFHFESPVSETEPLELGLAQLSQALSKEMSKKELTGHTVWLQVETEDDTHRYERVFSKALRDRRSIYFALKLTYDKPLKEAVTGIRAVLPYLTRAKSVQRSLDQNLYTDRKLSVEIAARKVQSSFGKSSIALGCEIVEPRRKRVLRAWKDARGWL